MDWTLNRRGSFIIPSIATPRNSMHGGTGQTSPTGTIRQRLFVWMDYLMSAPN